MIVDLETPDSYSQIENLRNLLQNSNPWKEDIAIAMLLAILIFYENRPGKLHGLSDYSIHGTGCHNPTSEKTGETIWNIWRAEIAIERGDGKELAITHEIMDDGYLKAVFRIGNSERIVTADISKMVNGGNIEATSVAINGDRSAQLMQDLRAFLKVPLDELLHLTLV